MSNTLDSWAVLLPWMAPAALLAAAGYLPTSISGVIGYGLLFLLTVCFISGADAGNMSKDFSWQFRLAAALRTPILVFVVIARQNY